MSTLNIIGNGFDLYHGLPTSYYDFACYILSTDERLYYDLAEMYDFPVELRDNRQNIIEQQIEDSYFWKDFEERLGVLSPTWVENSLLDDLGLESPEAVDLEVSAPDRTAAVKAKMNEWILSLDTDDVFEIVRSKIETGLLKFGSNDQFISFNYTHTLEKIYHISNVLHIHGEASISNEPDDLILGHGNSKEIDNLDRSVTQIQQQPYSQYCQSSRNRINELLFKKKILSEFKKSTFEGIIKLRHFFDEMPPPEYICAYGLSFGDVDMPYFLYIREKYPNAKWLFSKYCPKDSATVEKVAAEMELPKSQYALFDFVNRTRDSICESIISKKGIHHYKKFNHR